MGDPHVLLKLSLSFDFVAILNWILSNWLRFHLVIIMHQLAWLLPVKSPNLFIAEAPFSLLLNLPFKEEIHSRI